MESLTNLTRGQMQAVEIIALKPSATNRSVAKELGVSENTISSWRKNPEFIASCFDRFRELYGMRLMNVMEAMFREAEEGSVPASRLILEHYGKLNTQINIKIDYFPVKLCNTCNKVWEMPLKFTRHTKIIYHKSKSHVHCI